MAKGAMTIAWERARPGMEKQALAAFMAGGELAQRRHKDGEVDRTSVFISANQPGGFRIYEGEYDQLVELGNSDEFRRQLARASTCVDGLRVELFRGGDDDTVTAEVTMWMEELGDLGLL